MFWKGLEIFGVLCGLRDPGVHGSRILEGFFGSKRVIIIGVWDFEVWLEVFRGSSGTRLRHCSSFSQAVF